jgi:hypothetical protein
MEVPIAVNASIGRSSSIGMEKVLIAKEKAAKRPPTAVPTTSIAHPVGDASSMVATWSRPGNGR